VKLNYDYVWIEIKFPTPIIIMTSFLNFYNFYKPRFCSESLCLLLWSNS